MVVIRLTRGGAKKKPYYSVRVADSRKSRDGSFLEKVGYFNPMARGQQKRLDLKINRIESWLEQGAQPSERVKKLVKDYKLGEEAVTARNAVKLEKKLKQKEKAATKKREELKEATEAATDS